MQSQQTHCRICSYSHSEPGALAGPELQAVQERQDREEQPAAEERVAGGDCRGDH